MKETTKISIALFVIVITVSLIVAWLAGYNFDKRGIDVACWAAVTLCLSAWVAMIPYSDEVDE
jgi:uncharacterized membrane protein YvlD (DUF360 family)